MGRTVTCPHCQSRIIPSEKAASGAAFPMFIQQIVKKRLRYDWIHLPFVNHRVNRWQKSRVHRLDKVAERKKWRFREPPMSFF